MTTQHKPFFQERTTEALATFTREQIFRPRGLVERILNVHDFGVLELRFPLRPRNFSGEDKSSVRVGRLNYKHGAYIPLQQPITQKEAYATKEIPLVIRENSFAKAMEHLKEEEIYFLGYHWYPVQGRDRRKRMVPFVWVPEGAKIFAYAEQNTQGIEIKKYDNAQRVKKEGADIVCTIPSRTQKKSRYQIKLLHVPVDGVTEKRAVTWSLKSQYDEGKESPHSIFNIRYTGERERENADVFTFYPQDIAAYLGVIKHYNEQHNLTPIEMTPLPLISRTMAHFATRLTNNVLIYDPTLKRKENKDKVRKLHIDERSILIARAIKVLGHEQTMYWDPVRDGRLKEYDWSIPGAKK